MSEIQTEVWLCTISSIVLSHVISSLSIGTYSAATLRSNNQRIDDFPFGFITQNASICQPPISLLHMLVFQ